MPYRTLAGALMLAVLASACGGPAETSSSPSGAPTVQLDSCGQQLSFEQPPERVVTLDQSSTEILLALGLQDRMAGTSNLKTEIAPEYQAAYAKVPVVAPKIPTAEQLRAATPDFVIGSFTDYYTKDRVGTRAELSELGLPSYVSAVDCPQDNKTGMTPFDLLFADYESFGRVFGVEDRASKLVKDQRAVVEQASATKPKVTDTPTVVWIYSVFNGLPYVAGATSLPAEMSRLVGAKNAFDDIDEDWPEASWEQIAQRDPDFIVLGDLPKRGAKGDSAADKLQLMKEHPTVSQLSAVRENKVLQMPGIELDPSVRTVHSLGLLVDGMRDLGYVR
ncbi:ABC transporter substrate-binding protein [Tenggerimyces flavus]|uniref:ABC transporter substrate-binding protein n=1 Tax=Tenggerimyces flavus TaxID=1708749 RepID=A0ABV7Y963_9ACTN|nr:ABC transporter substrate-binding protein [Tenggerimyces flavus]MBM7785730.1 iron complex transport system substrate-binding protein [Tenggerimyces flavus]